jgi:hypothetical protein
LAEARTASKEARALELREAKNEIKIKETEIEAGNTSKATAADSI